MNGPKVAGVIGWPVAHSKSPLIHRFWLGKLGIDGEYCRFPVAPERLGQAMAGLAGLGIAGVNVTVPHKLAVLAHLDEIDAGARAVGAVNTVEVMADGRLRGWNSDVAGVFEPTRELNIAGREVILVGTGGAARAAMAAMVRHGAAQVTVLARDLGKGEALLAAFGQAGRVVPMDASLSDCGDVALLFNASVLGMVGQPAFVPDFAGFPDDLTVFDAVYAPLETPLLAAARGRGLRVIDGLSMLIGQAAMGFEVFFGAPAPRDFDAELRAVLVA
jgi:shikimate dehydrogenase